MCRSASTFCMLMCRQHVMCSEHWPLPALNLHDGPFVKGLDKALQSFKVQRQQYFGGVFVGNHIHKTLQVRINELRSVVKLIHYLASKHQVFVHLHGRGCNNYKYPASNVGMHEVYKHLHPARPVPPNI